MPKGKQEQAAELSPAQQNVVEIEAALAALDTFPESLRSTMQQTLDAKLADALGVVAVEQAEVARQVEKSAALAAVDAMPESIRDAMRAAIEASYAPVVETPPVETQETSAGRRPLSERHTVNNALAAAEVADPIMAARMLAYWQSYTADAPKLASTIQLLANTRFSAQVLLAPTGEGVSGQQEWNALQYRMRAYLSTLLPKGTGEGIVESAWQAARKRYAPATGIKSANASYRSGARVALFPDGRFRLALPGTDNVRYLQEDEAAWRLFAPTSTTEANASAALAASTTPVAQQASLKSSESNGTQPALAALLRCKHCNVSNPPSYPKCRGCSADAWQPTAD